LRLIGAAGWGGRGQLRGRGRGASAQLPLDRPLPECVTQNRNPARLPWKIVSGTGRPHASTGSSAASRASPVSPGSQSPSVAGPSGETHCRFSELAQIRAPLVVRTRCTTTLSKSLLPASPHGATDHPSPLAQSTSASTWRSWAPTRPKHWRC
jgi:hypothetical protein